MFGYFIKIQAGQNFQKYLFGEQILHWFPVGGVGKEIRST